jgi:hypothetical protein
MASTHFTSVNRSNLLVFLFLLSSRRIVTVVSHALGAERT